jgi:preprotein translocase subunit SecE
MGVRIPPGLPDLSHGAIELMERTGKLVITDKFGHGIEKVKNSWTSIKTFFSEVITETKKVTWPGMKEVRDTTIVVIIAVIIFGIFLYFVDLALGEILHRLLKSIPTR